MHQRSCATVYEAYSRLAMLQELLKMSAEQLPEVLLCFWEIQDGPVNKRSISESNSSKNTYIDVAQADHEHLSTASIRPVADSYKYRERA